jgi:hypothetical protein
LEILESGALGLVKTVDRGIYIKRIQKNRNFYGIERDSFDVCVQRGTTLLFFESPDRISPSLKER